MILPLFRMVPPVSLGLTPPAAPAAKVSVAAANSTWSVPALWVFLGSYVVFGGVTWFVYLRGSYARGTSPSLVDIPV